MTLFSKTVSFNDMVPILPALDLPVTLKMLFSHKNFVHALAGAVVSTSYALTNLLVTAYVFSSALNVDTLFVIV